MRRIAESELILNPNGSVYHLNLLPENISHNIIFVGDQKRVDRIAAHFDKIEFETQKREFHTVTGVYKNKRLSVMSTGIGPDNIDIVMNELDALVNIDLDKRVEKLEHTTLNIVRIGTSGSLQADIPVDSFVLGKYGLGMDGMLHYYDATHVREIEMEEAFIRHTQWASEKAHPYIVKNSDYLEKILLTDEVYSGITGTAGGFFGPQGRVLRLPLSDPKMNAKMDSFEYKGVRMSNLEMETSAIYGLAKLLGHNACSMNAIIANRANMTFSEDPYKPVDGLIKYTLDKMILLD